MAVKDILEYKGYFTKIRYSKDDGLLYGKIEGINDYIDFYSESAKEIENEFHQAVDDYLSVCEQLGDEPNKTYKGVFNVRITPELHKEIAFKAFREDDTVNGIVSKAIAEYIKKDKEQADNADIQEIIDVTHQMAATLDKMHTDAESGNFRVNLSFEEQKEEEICMLS